MSPRTRLQIPSVETFRRRAGTSPEGRDRYVITGGFVQIEELSKIHAASKSQRSRQNNDLYGHVSPLSQSSRGSSFTEDGRGAGWDSLPTTPSRSECCQSPVTPRTPFSGTKQTTSDYYHYHTPDITPPPLSKYNRYGHDLYLSVSPKLSYVFQKISDFNSQVVTPTQHNPQADDAPIELAGSLLLPSQGFPQTNPPMVPPYANVRSHSAPVFPQLSQSPSMIHKGTVNPVVSDGSGPTMVPIPSGTTLNRAMMRDGTTSQSTITSDRDTQGLLPARKSSLRSKLATPRNVPPPTPLSKMSLEQLIQVLPSLDAAIIAQDWLPCMLKRHQELKYLLETTRCVPTQDVSPQPFNPDFEKLLDQSHDVARTYHKLFEIAKDLQSTDVEKKNVQVDEANARASEAKIALARHVLKHRDVCQAYEREIQETKDVTRHIYGEASSFIHRHLNNSGAQLEMQQAQHILELLTNDGPRDIPDRHISTDLYHDTQKALRKVTEEKYDLQEVCSTQMATIRKQSSDFDRHTERMTKVMETMQDKEFENRELRAQNDELKLIVNAHENAIRANEQSRLDQEQFQRAVSQTRSLNDLEQDAVQARDAEITNLRGKLDKALAREQDLQAQIRSLLQSTQNENVPSRQGRLKRLLTGGPRGTTNLPTTTSMHNLSHSIFTPFETGRSLSSRPSSPTKSGKSSPTLAGLCEPGMMDNLERPPPHNYHNRTLSPVERGPRLREGFQSAQDKDINSAVSGRFYHMPSNVKSAASILRSQTPKEVDEPSYSGISEHGRPRQNSAPGNLDLGKDSCRQGYTDRDQQVSMNHQRVLSGITEVTEDTGSVKRNSSSPSSVDRQMYMESMRALGRLQVHY